MFGAGDLTIGSVYLVFTYVELLRLPMERIRDQMEDLQKAGAGITRAEELFSVSTKVIDSGTDHLPAGPLSVSFDRVTLATTTRTPGAAPAPRRCPSRSGSGSFSGFWADGQWEDDGRSSAHPVVRPGCRPRGGRRGVVARRRPG